MCKPLGNWRRSIETSMDYGDIAKLVVAEEIFYSCFGTVWMEYIYSYFLRDVKKVFSLFKLIRVEQI